MNNSDERDYAEEAANKRLLREDDDAPAKQVRMPEAWADGFGVWHVRVSAHAAWPLGVARRTLRDELQQRDASVVRDVWMHPVRVPEKDTDDTIVYRENV